MQMQLYGTLRGESGVRQVDIDLPEDATIGSALSLALAQDPHIGRVLLDSEARTRQDLLILRNGRDIRLLQGLDTPLALTDRVDIFPLTGAQRAFAVD